MREQLVLKSLIVAITLMFTTTAFAQEKCKSISEINRKLAHLLDRVELVPPDEADYIRKETEAATKEPDDPQTFTFDRINRLQARRFYATALLRDNTARTKQRVEAAERATAAKDRARLLIEALSEMHVLFDTVVWYTEADDKRQQPTMDKLDKANMGISVGEAAELTTDILQCVVNGL